MSRGWFEQSERGGALAVGLLARAILALGSRAGQLLIAPGTALFFAVSPAARAASRDFLARARGRPATTAEVFRHFLSFASVVFDRLFMLTGRTDGYRIDIVGLGPLQKTLEAGGGCVLLGAHLGSFDVLRALSRQSPVRIRPLMYQRNGGALSRLFAKLDPRLDADIIAIGTSATMLEVRESVARGEVVGILGDRAPRDQKCLPTPFFGAPALFPTGPIILASMLAVPSYLCFGIRTGPRRYRIHLEPFADAITLNRATRQADLQHWLSRYAQRLEHHARENPYNWFNFFDFWKTGEAPVRARAGPMPTGLGTSAPV